MMSCSPLCQPIRFLVACTLESFCFSVAYIDVCRGDGAFASLPRFSFYAYWEHVQYLIKYLCVRMRVFGGGVRKKGRSSQRIPSIINNLNITYSLRVSYIPNKLYHMSQTIHHVPFITPNTIPST